MPITGHASPIWNGYEAVSAHEELLYNLQNGIIAAEVAEDAVALAGAQRAYVFVLMRGKETV